MGDLTSLFASLQSQAAETTVPRPYRNAMVRFRRPFTMQERIDAAEAAGWNVFQFPSAMLSGCDMLSDSGTTTMTAEQWAQMILGDEAYGTNEGYVELREVFAETFGQDWVNRDLTANNVFLFHQGRAAEHALFTLLARSLRAKHPGQTEPWIVPSNAHFDTTEANIYANAMVPVNLFSPTLKDPASIERFKGDLDTAALREVLAKDADRVPIIYTTITNNTGGGQPVSMSNLREVSAIAKEYGKPFFLDACRFAENAWFIQQYEPGFADWSIPRIVHETFTLADGLTISLKKDGLGNMGGALIVKPNSRFTELYPDFLPQVTDHQILVEGHPTYGGLTGRDIKALCQGLRTVVTPEYLKWRIEQTDRFGRMLLAKNVPVLTPFGGHAVYLKVDEFFADTPLERQDFGGIALTGLLLAFGHRLCELGAFAFGTYHDGQHSFDNVMNYVRCAIPRLMFEDADLQALADILGILYQERQRIPAIDVTYGLDLPLRHFKARFKFRGQTEFISEPRT